MPTKRPAPPLAEERVPVKLPRSSYELARELLTRASRNGWSSLGVDRDDPPSILAILDEALKRFAADSMKPRKK